MDWVSGCASRFSDCLSTPAKKLSLGVTMVTNEAASLERSSAVFTFGYKIKINDNHSVRFGISGGTGYSKLNVGDADFSNDPAVLNSGANQFYASGNFGMVYVVKGWQLGFALPEIIGQPYIDHQNDYRQLRRQLYSLSYRKFNLEGIAVNPYFIFNTNLLSQNSWEAATVMYYKEKIWTGLSYHQYNGGGFFFGLKILEGFQFSYSYELPPVSQSFVNTASHEFQMKLSSGLFRAKNHPQAESPGH